VHRGGMTSRDVLIQRVALQDFSPKLDTYGESTFLHGGKEGVWTPAI